MYVNEIVKTKTSYPLSASDLKDHLSVDADFTDDDLLIDGMIKTAFRDAEKYTGRDIVLTDNELEIEDFNSSQLKVHEAPYESIQSIKVYDENDVETILDQSSYKVRRKKTYFTIVFDSTISAERMVLNFRTGYTSLPEEIRGAVAIKTNDLYDIERTSMVVGVNFRNTEAFQNLLSGLVINRW